MYRASDILCVSLKLPVPGAQACPKAGSADAAAFADAEDSASDETLSSDGSMTHPVHDYCQEELDSVELDFRIEPPSKSILDNFDHYTVAVVIVDRWYKHEGHTIAYSLSFIPIELVGRLQIDLNSTDALLKFLEHTCYEQGITAAAVLHILLPVTSLRRIISFPATILSL